MKTSIDLANIVYQKVKQSGVLQITSGGVYLGRRPFDSKGNDIVVNTLTKNEEQLEFGTINVQIYAQNLHRNNTYYPNLNLLNEAIKLLKPLFKDTYFSEDRIYIDIEAERYYQVENTQEWVGVLILETRNIN